MRNSGLLMHITSLPSAFGIGDLGPAAYAMVDFLSRSGQRCWQVLPINPTDGINGHSPYSCFSAFAGNPLIISPEGLCAQGYLTKRELQVKGGFPKGRVDFAKAEACRQRMFAAAFSRFRKQKDKSAFQAFCAAQDWLEDYAVFRVAKEQFKGATWIEWPLALRRRKPKALADFARRNQAAIEQVKFIQYIFFGQWQRLKTYANSRKVQIIGDIPIYVNFDSVEVWCNPQYFKLSQDGHLKFVSGCPPDYFSKTGQRWGNPVYDWVKLKKDGYVWWVRRIQHNLSLFDLLRIDHFRGFAGFWQIPAHEKFAVFGRWVKGPGKDFFKALMARLPELPLIAEDLGEITPDVPALMRHIKIPGMRVLLFGFNGNLKDNPHVPANYVVHCVAYTGTHDNNTVQGWYKEEAKPHEKANIPRVLQISRVRPRNLHWTMTEALFMSRAQTTIVPVADILGLGSQARMNTPATKMHNWQWMLGDRMLNQSVARKLLKLTRKSKRASI